ncbi:MAG: peroxidase-related enzyme, partial [Thermomicrobiales bacterium]
GCVFCASVHARIYASKAKKRDLIQRFLDDGVDTNLPPAERAIVDLSATLTVDPESLTSDHLQPLRALGFDDLAILDVLNYAAFFANANRLMLTLGEPRLQRTSAA